MEPETRYEKILKAIADAIGGNEIEDVVPETRGEYFLGQIAAAIESGGGGGTMYVECTEAEGVKTLNKSYKEITDAVAAGMYAILHMHVIETGEGDAEIPIDLYCPLGTTAIADGIYQVAFTNRANYEEFTADSETAPLTNS